MITVLAINTHAASAPYEVMQFKLKQEGETQPFTLSFAPNRVRVDKPGDKFAVIHDETADIYTGLEWRDALYWEFSWPEVEKSIQKTKSTERHFHDLNIPGMASYDLTRKDPIKEGEQATVYQWLPTEEKKKIGAYTCTLWEGADGGSSKIQVWCTEEIIPHFKENWARVSAMNEPMALVPVRPLLPEMVFAAFDHLLQAGLTPVEIDWGPEKNQLLLIKTEEKNGAASVFAPPETFREVQLTALEGLIEDKPTDPESK